MSGRGRKQPNPGGNARRSQPVPKRGAGPSRPATSGSAPRSSAQRQQAAPASGSRKRGTQPVADVRSQRPPVTSPGAARVERRERAQRRKRNQRLGVVIGAVALGGAAIGGVIAGMAGGAEPDRTANASSGPTLSAGAEVAAGPTVDATASAASAAPAPAGLTITCPTDAGASPVFGHDVIVPEPYEITIDYGDGDVYTNDSDNLDAIFSHTYADPGTYTVNAVLTPPAGATTSATCDYTWGP